MEINVFLAWLVGNYKIVGLFLMIAVVAGYVALLRHSVQKQAIEIAAREDNISILKKDLDNSKDAIKNMNEGIRNFQSIVNRSLDSIKNTQSKIALENKNLQVVVDNLVASATAAIRIRDAPKIPFFMGDNVVVNAILIGVDNGANRYRLLPPVPPAR